MTTLFAPPDQAVFQQQVWQIVRQVPEGKVTTYGRLAELVGAPKGVDVAAYRANGPRWVGSAMAVCPEDVPWHRVVNAQGKISIRSGGGHLRQRALLAAEGVLFDQIDRIDLKKYDWEAPETWEQKSLW